MNDFLASVVVFLVALPLCMGVAIASGLPPAAGLITGIVGGIIVGSLQGSPFQVSGPAAGLSVIVFDQVAKFGVENFAIIVLLAGLLQALAAIFGLGQWFRAVSPSVIYGMLAGIGILIFSSQFHVMFDGRPAGSGLDNFLGIGSRLKDLVFTTDAQAMSAGFVGLVTISALVAWNTYKPARLKAVPGALIGVVAGTAVASLWKLPVRLVEIPANLMDTVKWPSFQLFTSVDGLLSIIPAALAIAFIASAESLLCASAVDQMHNGPKTKYNKELFAQGVGNAICGMLGALPMTGVIVRSAANVEAGARSRASAILHGIWILLLVAALPGVLEFIPMAALAGVLVFTGFKLVNVAAIREIARYGREDVMVYVVTVFGIVFADLLTGVLIGLAVALMRLLLSLSKLDMSVEETSEKVVVRLNGVATFLHLPKLARFLDGVSSSKPVSLDLESLRHIDHACENLLASWKKSRFAEGKI